VKIREKQVSLNAPVRQEYDDNTLFVSLKIKASAAYISLVAL